MSDTPSPSPEAAIDDAELKDSLEAAFGPGALDLISEQAEVMPPVSGEPTGTRPGQPCRPLDDTGPAVGASTLLMFELDGTPFGFAITDVLDIRQVPALTRISRGPDWFRGLANLRGTVIPVVDLRLRLGMAPERVPAAGHLIVVRSSSGSSPTGLIVDTVTGLQRGSDAASRTTDSDNELIIDWIDHEGDPVAILDLDGILRPDDTGLRPA
jgi:chemotaxis signal transduction protein